MPRIQRLRARWALPISTPPIQDAEVILEDDCIAEVRPRRIDGAPSAASLELGESILLPGLVNCHTHLEYTVMRGLLEDLPFFSWIRELTARKAALDAEDWNASAVIGAAEAVQGGVTTIGDCTDSGAAMAGALALGLRGTIYQEVFSLEESLPVSELVEELGLKVADLRRRASGSLLRVGISPHAPYTVRPEAFKALMEYARRENLPVCIHAAESHSESEWLRTGGGVIGERDRNRGIGWLDPPPGISPLAHLHRLGALGPQTLLVHGVQVSAADRGLICESGVAWAHCPKSNAKLGNGIAPLGLLRSCTDRIGLASDGVASNNSMDLFEEMRFAVLVQRARTRRYDAMTATQALEMATLGSARALGLEKDVGSLDPGKRADLVALSLDRPGAAPAHDPVSAAVYAASARDVRLTMIGGETVYESGRFLTAELSAARRRLEDAAERLRRWSPES